MNHHQKSHPIPCIQYNGGHWWSLVVGKSIVDKDIKVITRI